MLSGTALAGGYSRSKQPELLKEETMKWGVIILWVAGLWTVLICLALLLGGFINEHITGAYFLWLVLASLPVWIFCGLIWATIYCRSRKKSLSDCDETLPGN